MDLPARCAIVLVLGMAMANADPMCQHQAGGICYVSTKPMTTERPRCMQAYKKYDEAKAECENLGMKLASISSAAENELVRKLCGEQACYIGLHERPDTEDWVWENGASLTGAYQNWYPGQPNNWRPTDAEPHVEEDAAAMNCWKGFDGRWCDVDGKVAAIGYVCMSDGACPAAASGLDTCELVAEDMLPNIDYNFTADGKTCEKTPTMNDGGEFCWHQAASKCYIGAHQHWDGKCAKGGKIFQQGRSVCRVFGGDLVKINSAEEQKAAQEACGDQMCWIGLKEGIGTESWTWADGSAASSYDNWAPGQPDNGVTHGYDDSHWNKAAVPGYDETAAVMNLIPNLDGKWRDTYETARFGFVCDVPKQICDEAAQGSTTDARLDVKDVLTSMKQCAMSHTSASQSSAINVFSFETNCEAKPDTVAPSPAPPAASQIPAVVQIAEESGDENDDDDNTVLIVIIIALAVAVVALIGALIVYVKKFRKASDAAQREMNANTYGNTA